MGSKRMTFK